MLIQYYKFCLNATDGIPIPPLQSLLGRTRQLRKAFERDGKNFFGIWWLCTMGILSDLLVFMLSSSRQVWTYIWYISISVICVCDMYMQTYKHIHVLFFNSKIKEALQVNTNAQVQVSNACGDRTLILNDLQLADVLISTRCSKNSKKISQWLGPSMENHAFLQHSV